MSLSHTNRSRDRNACSLELLIATASLVWVKHFKWPHPFSMRKSSQGHKKPEEWFAGFGQPRNIRRSHVKRQRGKPGHVRPQQFITYPQMTFHFIQFSICYELTLTEQCPTLEANRSLRWSRSPRLHGTRNFIAVFKRARYWSLSWASSIQYKHLFLSL